MSDREPPKDGSWFQAQRGGRFVWAHWVDDHIGPLDVLSKESSGAFVDERGFELIFAEPVD